MKCLRLDHFQEKFVSIGVRCLKDFREVRPRLHRLGACQAVVCIFAMLETQSNCASGPGYKHGVQHVRLRR